MGNALVLLVLLPAVVAAVIPLVGRISSRAVPVVALVGPLVALVLGVSELAGRLPIVPSGRYEWFTTGIMRQLVIGWNVDILAGVMLVVVGVVASCVVVFSSGYMHGDEGWARYFAVISLFVASMNLLVIADGFVALFFGWELVGACSYLLIGFWFTKPTAVRAAIKAFLTTRVGDVGLLLGMAVLWTTIGSLQYGVVFLQAETLPTVVVTTAAVLIAIGAFGKSAQFPLHIWLPDAMEGPTPVSALIHAATMVAAGVYLIARTWPLFELAPGARTLILVVGTVSALGAGLAAVAQTDIKRVLAYSTISQLGFMFAALGVGAWAVAIFHLVTHAAFKALLFLGAGSVIHGSGTQNLREMGGLRSKMPITFVTWVIGALALGGVPPLAGFFSKDEILANVLHQAPLAGIALAVTAFATAFYMARTTRLAFFGERRAGGHAHEAPLTMTIPLMILAFLALILGLVGAPLLRALGEPAEEFATLVAVTSTLIAAVGLVAGWLVEPNGAYSDEAFESRLGPVWRWAESAWGWNAIMMAAASGIAAGCRIVWAFGDRLVMDGAAEGAGWLARATGSAFSKMQTGEAQWYVALIVLGTALAIAVAVVAR